jgi:hypothetical protein
MNEADQTDFSDALEWGKRLHKAGVLEEAAEACGHLAVAFVGLESPEGAQVGFCQGFGNHASVPAANGASRYCRAGADFHGR